MQFGISQTTNKQVIVQAETGTTVNSPNVLLSYKAVQYTSALGICTFSNLYGSPFGYYHVTIPAPPQRFDFDIFVSNTNLGLVQASTLIGVFGASTYPESGFAWTAQVSDARYARATNSPANFVSFNQLVITSNGIVNIIGAETNNIHVWGDKSFATTNQMETTNAALLGAISLKANQADWITGSNGIRLALNLTNTILLAQINAGGSVNPTNDLSIALNRSQTNSTTITSNGLLALINAGGSTSPTNDLQVAVRGQIVLATNNLSIALNAAQTNSTTVTSNSLILKFDATNLVNVYFSNSIANFYGLGTNTTLQTSVFIGVTNVKVLLKGSVDGSGMIITNFDTAIITNQLVTANVLGITNSPMFIGASSASKKTGTFLTIAAGSGNDTNGGDLVLSAGNYSFVNGPFTGNGGNVSVFSGSASPFFHAGNILLQPGLGDSAISGTNIIGRPDGGSKNRLNGETIIRDGDDVSMRGVFWTNLISLKSSNGVQITFGATNDYTISLSFSTNSFVYTNQIALYTLTTDFLVESNKQKVDLASTNALLLAQISAGGSTNPTNDLNTALIARIAAATNSAQMVFWGSAPDPSGVLSAPKGAIYTFLTNGLPKYQLINTNGTTGWY